MSKQQKKKNNKITVRELMNMFVTLLIDNFIIKISLKTKLYSFKTYVIYQSLSFIILRIFQLNSISFGIRTIMYKL